MAKTMRYRKKSSKKQKMYKMKGCSHLAGKSSKLRCPVCGMKMKGGSPDAPLAYTGHAVNKVANPFLAYTGHKGGARQMGGNKFPYNNTHGILAVNKLPTGANLNASFQRGGGVVAGPAGISGYQPAAFYPDGTVGNSWTPAVSGWPGVDGISSDRNFLSLNTYPNDPQTQNILSERTTSNYGLKGGRSRRGRRGGKKSRKAKRGGTLLSLNQMLPSDILNPLRSASYSVQGSVAAIQGRTQPPDPLPQNSQLVGSPSYNSLAMFR